MPTSDSEGFESADEGGDTLKKKDRKRGNSSSCYSDNDLETGGEVKKAPAGDVRKEQAKVEEVDADGDGWDDFNIDDSEPATKSSTKLSPISIPKGEDSGIRDQNTSPVQSKEQNKDTGWDKFDDWGDDNVVIQDQPRPKEDKDIKELPDQFATTVTTPSSSGWGWGWGVDSLLNTATAGISSITNQMSQGISTVLESGIGAPDPEELAKERANQRDSSKNAEGDFNDEIVDDRTDDKAPLVGSDNDSSAFGGLAPLGSLFKFVGSAGSKVIHGGLDTLEIIGRKTMEVLQENDPNLRKKRELLGLTPGVPVLSQVLREAKEKAEEEDRIREEKQEAKEVHFENLFDDFGGLVHLEALEILSKQCHFKIEEKLRDASPDQKHDIKETLLMVAQLCELPDENDDEIVDEIKKEDDKIRHKSMHPTEVLLEKLQKATEDLAIKIQFQPLVKQYGEILKYLEGENDFSPKTLLKKAVSSLAEATSLALEIYHKAAEMLLVLERRMVADEADSLTQMTAVLAAHLTDVANLYVDKMSLSERFSTDVDIQKKVTHIFLVANNSATYVQNALLLLHTVLQVGAV